MNKSLSEILINQYDEKCLSHIFLIETNNIISTKNEIASVISYIESKNNIDKSKIFKENIYPGIICIEPDGTLIKKAAIDEMKNIFSYMPQFTLNNYYVISSAEKMNSQAYNRLLKFMEEPMDHIIGFLLTNNKSLVPETIISRCDFYRDNYYTKNDYDSYEEAKQMYINFIKNKDLAILWYNESVLSEMFTEKLHYSNFLNALLEYYLYEKKLLHCNIIKNYLKKLDYNVNLSLFINSFAIEMVSYE